RQIDAFLAREPGFAPLDHDRLWSGCFGGHAGAAYVERDRGISLTPARTGTDGFFFAALVRADAH
ncbi:MFS transporter, partial [Mesorhizobium sp. ZMM04-4]